MADRNANIIISLRNQADPEVRKLASSFRDLIQRLRDAGATQEQAERKALSHAQALAQLAARSGNAAQSERILTAAISQANQESTAAIRAQTQLVGIQNKLRDSASGARAGFSGLASSLGQLKTLAGGLGIGLGIQQLISGGIEAGGAALQLRETKNSLKAVAGDTQTYTRILGEARRQQLLFGGSLQENIDGLQGLAVTSRQSGADLGTLIDLQKRLTVLNPAQGAQGGLIALNEALAGNITSLSRRFNIPRDTIRKLGDESLPVAERLKVLDQFLSSVGITSQAVANRVDQDALAYRRLAQELGDLKTSAGDGLAGGFSRAATGLSRLLGVVNGNPQAIAELKALFSGQGTISQQDIDQAARGVAETRARQQLGGARGAPVIQARLGGREQFEEVGKQLVAINLKGQDAARAADQLTQEWIRSGAGADDLRQRLSALLTQLNGASQGTTDLADRHRDLGRAAPIAIEGIAEFSKNLEKNAIQAQVSAAQSQILKGRQVEIAETARLAALGMLGEGDQAELLAQKLNIARNAAVLLINEQSRLAGQQALADQRAGEQGRVSDEVFRSRQRQNAAAKQLNDAYLADQKRVADAQLALDLARAKTSGERIAILSRELAGTTDVAERLRIQAQIESERNSGARAHTSELTKQLNLEERIADSKEKQLRSAIDAQLALLDDRKQRRQEERELARAQRILASGSANADFRAAAADVLQRIPLEQARRALDIRDKLTTAGGQLVNGRIFQSVPRGGSGGALPALPALPGGPTALPAIPALPGGGMAGGVVVDVQVTLDGQQIAAVVTTRLRGGLDSAAASGLGRRP